MDACGAERERERPIDRVDARAHSTRECVAVYGPPCRRALSLRPPPASQFYSREQLPGRRTTRMCEPHANTSMEHARNHARTARELSGTARASVAE